MSTRSIVTVAALSMFSVSCASSSSSKASKSGNGRSGRSLADVEVAPPQLLAAKKIERPLYIVLDPTQVADTQGPVRWSWSKYDVTNFTLFVSRDLKKAMETFFSEVHVVAPNEAVPSTGAVVADVRVDKLEGKVIGQVAVAELTWAFALRPVEADTYQFSFAGTSSNAPSRSVAAMLQSTLERAITDMLGVWTEKDVTQALRALPAAGASPDNGDGSTAL